MTQPQKPINCYNLNSRGATHMLKLGGVEFDRIVLSLELDEWMRRLQGKETF